jgi:uncharacterized DUF497 family protein
MITWDENKRQTNIAKHGIDFIDCEVIFDHPMITKEDDREVYGEQRLQSLGLLHGIVVFMVWVDYKESAHIISVRKALKHEKRYYWKRVSYGF